MTAYYNENDAKAAAWLRELIHAGLIADGDVDDRSITDVKATDLVGYTQCHFFAGISGWSYALRLAGWPDAREVWTGSCPCQSFSTAGRHAGVNDPRHLWPVWAKLIAECRPPVVLGEQVPAAIGHGWLDLVCDDLEAASYAVGACVLGAHSVGAPHKRQRLYWVANREFNRLEGQQQARSAARPTGRGGELVTVDHAMLGRHESAHGTVCAGRDGAVGTGVECVADATDVRRDDTRQHGSRPPPLPARPVERGPWDLASTVWLPCRDGKQRPAPTEPALQPLVPHGFPGRVGILRGAGNAVCVKTAAQFIKAYLEVTS